MKLVRKRDAPAKTGTPIIMFKQPEIPYGLTSRRASQIAAAKQRLPLPELMQRLGLGEHAKKSARCPFHDDQHNSFSVWQTSAGAWLFKCHADCGDGDEISFLSLYEKLPPGDAIKRYFDLAGLNGSSSVHAAEPFDWMACVDAFTDGDLEHLADWRGLSGLFCSWLRKQALVGSHHGRVAFPVHDDVGKIVGAHVLADVLRFIEERKIGKPVDQVAA
jgi:hypothetical protein